MRPYNMCKIPMRGGQNELTVLNRTHTLISRGLYNDPTHNK